MNGARTLSRRVIGLRARWRLDRGREVPNGGDHAVTGRTTYVFAFASAREHHGCLES